MYTYPERAAIFNTPGVCDVYTNRDACDSSVGGETLGNPKALLAPCLVTQTRIRCEYTSQFKYIICPLKPAKWSCRLLFELWPYPSLFYSFIL